MTWIDTSTPENGLADLVNTTIRDTFKESTAVVYTPTSTGVPESISATFDDLPVDATLEALDVEHSASGPTLGVRLADLSVAPARGDSCVVRGTTYKVVEAEDDSRGWGTLSLLRVS